MKLFRNLALGLLAATLAVSMLTACGGSSTPSTPSTPSNPGTSQGGTEQTPENPGGSETPDSGEEKPDENPAQKTWATSLIKAYLDSLGVTSENYHVYNTNYAATVLFYNDGKVVDGDNDFCLDLAVHGSKRLIKMQYAANKADGLYTDGQNYYALDGKAWKKIIYTELDPFYDYLSTIEAKINLDVFLGSSFVPAASDIEDFQVTTTTNGVTEETVTLKNKTVCTYFFDAEHKLTAIRSKVPESKYQELPLSGLEIQMKNPTFEKSSQSAIFPTTFSDKPYQWTDDSETEDLPKTWADSKTKAYLTKNGITKENFYIQVADYWSFGICTCEVSGQSKSIRIQSSDGLISGYAYADGTYTVYEGTEAAPSTRDLTNAEEITAAQKFFAEIEAYIAIPSDVEITAFRAYEKGNGYGDEKFITTDGKQYTVRLDDDDSIRSVSVYLPNGDSAWVDVEEFKRTSTGTTAMFDMWTMLLNLF